MFSSRILLSFCLCCLLVACTSNKVGIHASAVNKWVYKQYPNSSLVTLNLRKKDVENIRVFMALYRVTNYQSQFNTLRFQNVLWDSTEQYRVYFFEVRDSGNVQAIFVLDEDDNLVDNFLVSSEQQLFTASMLKPWKFQPGFYRTFTAAATELKNDKVIDSLVKLYRLNSADPYFNELTFDKVLTGSKDHIKAYVFYIQHVHDVQAVFELDKDDKLIDNYMTSLWER